MAWGLPKAEAWHRARAGGVGAVVSDHDVVEGAAERHAYDADLYLTNTWLSTCPHIIHGSGCQFNFFMQ